MDDFTARFLNIIQFQHPHVYRSVIDKINRETSLSNQPTDEVKRGLRPSFLLTL